MEERILKIQHSLRLAELDGWLFYDFRRSNDLACQFLGIEPKTLLTRRFFYWIPKNGEPIKIVHRIEEKVLDHLPGNKRCYHSWRELEAHVASLLSGSKRIAMEYSPRNAIPYLSKVDAGTVDLIRELGVEVVSSADLMQAHTAVWDSYKLETHLAAAKVLEATVDKAWRYIADSLMAGRPITEYAIQQYILKEFAQHDCISGDSPICAVNAHSADPHYCAPAGHSQQIEPGDFILIDLWCKQNKPGAVYADITRVGVTAPRPTPRQQAIFDIVKKARDAGTELVKSRFSQGKPLMGCEVDHCCREVIGAAGYGEFFIHRTGHNIDENDHGNGANLDSLETKDTRLLLPGTCFSIEPGIYLPGEFGVRLEYDVFVHPRGQVQITGGIQDSITCFFNRR